MRRLVLAVVLIGCHHGDAPPPGPSCTATGDHVLSLLGRNDQHATDVRGLVITRCQDDHWSAEVRSCMVGTTSLADPRHCKAKLSTAQRAAFDGDLLAADERATQRTMPNECVRYAAIIKKLDTCDRIPRATVDSLRQMYQLEESHRRALSREDAAEACRTGAVVVDKTATLVCGW